MGLRVYTVHLPSLLSWDKTPVLIKEGFSWGGFVFGMIWALWHRLWIEAAALLALTLAVGVIADYIDLSEPIEAAVMVTIAVLVGCSGHDWRRESLRQRGYHEIGVVVGPNMDEALRRFLDLRELDAQSHAAPAPRLAYRDFAAPLAVTEPYQAAIVTPPPASSAAPASVFGAASLDQIPSGASPGFGHGDNALRDYRPRR